MWVGEQIAPVIWKAIRRDVIAGLALGGALASEGLKVETSGPSLCNASAYALVARSAADALIAELDEAERTREPTTGT